MGVRYRGGIFETASLGGGPFVFDTGLLHRVKVFRVDASGRTFGRTCGQTSGWTSGRTPGRTVVGGALVVSGAEEKKHLIEAAPFGRLDQMLSTII